MTFAPEPEKRLLPGWFLALTAAVAAAAAASVLAADRPLARRLATLDDGIVSAIEKVTLLGSSEPYLIGLPVLGGVLFFLGRSGRLSAATWFTFATIALSGLIVDAVKVGAGRLRPRFYLDQGLHGLEPLTFESAKQSFPSGHAAVGTALAIGIGTFYPRLRVPLAVAAAAIAASRVALTVHYLSDVICGAYAAVLAALVVRGAARKLGLWPGST
jgi:membrane-associated phospholipid phosphatase